MKDRKSLPESELDIMLVVWSAGGPVSAPKIMEGLERRLTASALHSYLKHMEEKGVLSCEKVGKVNYYRPLISREEYQRQESRSILSKLYAGSLKHFAAALYDGGALTGADVEELRVYLNTLKEE